ncbi:unnamed protein product [Brachionus calyciflorus]|uniref:Atos-like conserved domain-containing protein n=1 Tax=Brachionus calyciflorus TaxID=104777 RepID=A0A813MLU3_9BILA|nr:unnamed protein product [Brachionus calyciflorus]
MQSLMCKRDESFRLDDEEEEDEEASKSELEEFFECLFNQILNSRMLMSQSQNTHFSHVVDLLMSKIYNLAIENNEYFPNQKFSSKNLPVHLCSEINDQCRLGLDIKALLNECLKEHTSNIGNRDLGLKRFLTVDTKIQIDVLLLSQCCLQKLRTENSNSILLINNRVDLSNLTYEILERWEITMKTENYLSTTAATENSKILININNLFQAIRSYLHFSQLSSWITNQTKTSDYIQQQIPKNIAFSISYSNEKDLDLMGKDLLQESNYNKQSFPLVNLQFLNNKLALSNSQSSKKLSNLSSTRIQMDLFSIKRDIFSNTTGIPQLKCLINHLNMPLMTPTIPIDIQSNKKIELTIEKSPDASDKSSIVITTPTTFPNIPLYFDANNNDITTNEQILQSTSPKVLISSFQLNKDDDITNDFEILNFNRKFNTNLHLSPVPSSKFVHEIKQIESFDKTEENLKEIEIKYKEHKLKNINSSHAGFSNLNFKKFRPNNLLGNFEECLLNGRLTPVGIVDGFYAEIGASGSFFPEHKILPVDASFYQVSDDIAASPYLGVIDLGSLGERGYRIPNKGTIQVTLFNPNKTVVKMFVVMYDLSDMPCNYKTFLRQRTVYVPCGNPDDSKLKSYLRYLIHLRFSTSKTGKMYLHTNIKLIFARNKSEIDPRMGGRYEYKTFTEAPKNPKYSPKK